MQKLEEEDVKAAMFINGNNGQFLAMSSIPLWIMTLNRFRSCRLSRSLHLRLCRGSSECLSCWSRNRFTHLVSSCQRVSSNESCGLADPSTIVSTRSHPLPEQLTGPMMEEELDKIEEAMLKILGLKPRLYMPPYGQIDTKNANISDGFRTLHKRRYSSG